MQEACLAWALETRQDTGVWGGTAEWDRRKMHRRYWREMPAVRRVLTQQRAELEAAVAAGLTPSETAKRLGTNVQTVNSAIKELATAKTDMGVAA